MSWSFFGTETVSPIRTFLRLMAGRGKALKREVGTNRCTKVENHFTSKTMTKKLVNYIIEFGTP